MEPRFRASPAPRYSTPTVHEPEPLRAVPNTLLVSMFFTYILGSCPWVYMIFAQLYNYIYSGNTLRCCIGIFFPEICFVVLTILLIKFGWFVGQCAFTGSFFTTNMCITP